MSDEDLKVELERLKAENAQLKQASTRGTSIKVATGPAVFASGVAIAREFVLDGGFSSSGGIVLDRAEIDGTLDFSGSHMTSALIARKGGPKGEIHDAVLDDRYCEAFTISGNAGDCRELAARYAAAGVTELALTFFGATFAADMAYIGTAFNR